MAVAPAQNAPAKHATPAADVLAWGQNLPGIAVQAVQFCAPAADEYLPAGHGEHLAAPDADRVPAGQARQLGEPALE